MNKDAGYIYGPFTPRSYFVGLKLKIYEHSHLTFGEDQYVPYRVSGKTMDIDLNSSIVSNPSDKTKALFEQNMDCISLRLRYSGDSI